MKYIILLHNKANPHVAEVESIKNNYGSNLPTVDQFFFSSILIISLL